MRKTTITTPVATTSNPPKARSPLAEIWEKEAEMWLFAQLNDDEGYGDEDADAQNG